MPPGLGFEEALAALKQDKRVSRAGWNGKGMWIKVHRPHAKSKMTMPYIFMKTVDGNFVPWQASQTDFLAIDWSIIE